MSALWRRKWQVLQYSCQENLMDSGAWRATVPGVEKSRTRLSNRACFHIRTLFLVALLFSWLWDTLILKFQLSFYSFFEVVLYYGLLSILPKAVVKTLEKSLRGPWVVWKLTQLGNLGSKPKSYETFAGTLAQAAYLSEHLLPHPSDDRRQYVTMGRMWVSGSSLGSNFESTIY